MAMFVWLLRDDKAGLKLGGGSLGTSRSLELFPLLHIFKGIQEYLQSKINFTEPGWKFNHE